MLVLGGSLSAGYVHVACRAALKGTTGKGTRNAGRPLLYPGGGEKGLTSASAAVLVACAVGAGGWQIDCTGVGGSAAPFGLEPAWAGDPRAFLFFSTSLSLNGLHGGDDFFLQI